MRSFRHPFRNTLLLRTLFIAGIIILSFAFGANALAGQTSEHDKIAYLLNAIGSSDLVFIRNETEYTGAEAKAHLQEKMDYAGSLIHTAEDFIDYIASESLTTGTPYYVRLADGTQVESGIWLRSKLAKMK